MNCSVLSKFHIKYTGKILELNYSRHGNALLFCPHITKKAFVLIFCPLLIYNGNLWKHKSKLQCFICQVCLENDLFLLFGLSVPCQHGMLDSTSRDEALSYV